MSGRPPVPAHAVEVRPDAPYTPEEWAFLCQAAAATMAKSTDPHRGIRCEGGSVFVWTPSPDPLAIADAIAASNHLVLKHLSGRALGYTLHAEARSARPRRG